MLERFRALAIVIGLVTLLLTPVFSPTARAATELPAWRTGDFWLYDISGNAGPQPGMAGTMRLGVLGTESVTVATISYLSYHLNLTFSITQGSLTLNIPGDAWFRTSDLAPVKLTFTMTITGPTGTFSFTVTVTYNPPPEVKWPLGSTPQWSASSTVRTITEITGQPPIDVNQTLSATYQVDPEESRTVPAGAFRVTPVTETDTTTGDYTREYWSRDAGNSVESTSYDSTDTETGSTKLRSYHYTPPSGGGGGILGLPPIAWGLLLVVLLVVVIAAVMMRRRRPSAPMPYPGVPPMTPGAPPYPYPQVPQQPPGPPGGPQPPPP